MRSAPGPVKTAPGDERPGPVVVRTTRHRVWHRPGRVHPRPEVRTKAISRRANPIRVRRDRCRLHGTRSTVVGTLSRLVGISIGSRSGPVHTSTGADRTRSGPGPTSSGAGCSDSGAVCWASGAICTRQKSIHPQGGSRLLGGETGSNALRSRSMAGRTGLLDAASVLLRRTTGLLAWERRRLAGLSGTSFGPEAGPCVRPRGSNS
jgi:hypothetical protein